MFTLLLLSNDSLSNEKKIYAWQDKNGILVFSDTPRVGAKEVKLLSKNLVMPSTDSHSFHEPQQPTNIKYRVLITSPEHKKTIRENTGTIYVTSRIEPIFDKSFKAQLFLDDKPQGTPGNTAIFVLNNIDRGEHTLQVKVFRGKQVVALSDIHIFYLHKKSIK
ncbi:DUF4124 domain-containing protein [Pseudoalteromonas sp. MMG010]|nr:DUF4124 domain-containing protein [Pseudoalteromonas sp. MMG010]